MEHMSKLSRNNKGNLYKKNPINYKDRDISHLEMINDVLKLGFLLDDTFSLTGYEKITTELIDEFISVKLPLIKNKKKRKEVIAMIEKIMNKIDGNTPSTSSAKIYSKPVNPHLMDEGNLYTVYPDVEGKIEAYRIVECKGDCTLSNPVFQIIADRSKRFKPDIDWNNPENNATYSINEMEYFLNKNSIKYGGYKNVYAVKYYILDSLHAEAAKEVEKEFVQNLNKIGIYPEIFIKVSLSSLMYSCGLLKGYITPNVNEPQPVNLNGEFDIFRTPHEASYQEVIDKIKEACENINYDRIAMTIYRLKAPYKDSEIYKALKCALDRGANVYLHNEILARGNERENIELYKEFSKYPNCHITTSYMGYKVHAKFFTAIDSSKEIPPFSHISTGNYNEKNAQTYADTQIFTNQQKIANGLFELMYKIQNRVPVILTDDSIITSPLTIRTKLLSLILQETEKGEDGLIYIKCNSLCDPIIIRQLYRAAMSGVKIRIICRGACSIYKFKNIKIKRILGYNLEHERFYIFGDDAYISSADLLIRNMDRRVEMLFNVSNVKDIVKGYFLKDWSDKEEKPLQIQFRINRNKNKKVKKVPVTKPHDNELSNE